MTAVTLPMMKAASAAYMEDHPQLSLAAESRAGSIPTNDAFNTGAFDYMINSIPPTVQEKAARPYLRAYPMIGNAVTVGYNVPVFAGTTLVSNPVLIVTIPMICAVLRANLTN